MNKARQLLEAYLQAKDFNCPSVILDCYTADAVLTYSIATDTIAFPEKVIGSDAIAQTLVRDFRKSFACCKTYYVCDSIPDDTERIDCLPWLVTMSQISTSALRLGKGWYRWEFERNDTGMRVCAMHIHIERMDIIQDSDGIGLRTLQNALPYPWLRPLVLADTLALIQKSDPTMAYVEEFQAPVRVPA